MPQNIKWNVPNLFFLYADESTPSLKVEEIAAYLGEVLGLRTKVRGDFLHARTGRSLRNLATAFAATRVRNVSIPFSTFEPSYGEVAYELSLLEDSRKKAHGILYDGGRIMVLLRDLLPAKERKAAIQHIIFTNRMIGTFGADGRYHAHVNICGYPSTISTSGIVEAPAKPKEYYLLKQRFIDLGQDVPFELLKERFAGRFIDYDDPRLTEVLKGYTLQCILHSITGEAFCSSRTCRFFNAHWQEELIKAQLSGERFCKKHQGLLGEIRRISRRVRK